MNTTPKSMRLQIALMGKVNSGKSSFLNLVTGKILPSPLPNRGTRPTLLKKIRNCRRSGRLPGWIPPVGAMRLRLAANGWKKPGKYLTGQILSLWSARKSNRTRKKKKFLRKPPNAKFRFLKFTTNQICRREATTAFALILWICLPATGYLMNSKPGCWKSARTILSKCRQFWATWFPRAEQSS